MEKRKRRHSKLNSLLSIFLSVCLVTANISVTALADEVDETGITTEIAVDELNEMRKTNSTI